MGRTNIVIDDDLIEEVMAITGATTKREAVDIALRRLVSRRKVYRALRKLRGKVQWEGDLESWRRKRA